jgi:two-component system KDP operon response regulator KdpE
LGLRFAPDESFSTHAGLPGSSRRAKPNRKSLAQGSSQPLRHGIQACRAIRAQLPKIGIVIVTVQDAESEIVKALEAGADDYITKPIRLRELVARLRAVLRRIQSENSIELELLRAEGLELDIERHTLYRRGEIVHLTPTEFELLAMLMRNEGSPVTHAKLLRSIWGPEYGTELEYLCSFIKTLRQKIEDDPATPKYIVTEPWVGYRFCNPVEATLGTPLVRSK